METAPVPVGQFHPGALKTVSDALALACWLPANRDKKASELTSAAITLFGCELVEAARSEWRAQPAQVVESSGCEGVTAGEAPAFDRLVGAIARGWCHPLNAHKEMDTDLVSAIASEIRADSQLSANAPWLTLAHNLCADAGVPSGHIADRLEGLRLYVNQMRGRLAEIDAAPTVATVREVQSVTLTYRELEHAPGPLPYPGCELIRRPAKDAGESRA